MRCIMLRLKRWLAGGFSIASIIIVVQILDVSKLNRPNKLAENSLIAAQDPQRLNERISSHKETIRAERINVQVENGGTFSANSSKVENLFKWRPLELSNLWREIKTIGDSVSLYPSNYNVEKVRRALQSAKIISAEKMDGDTAMKWSLLLDGNQRVIFKPSLQSRHSETRQSSLCGCEHPEYEITGFALNRMLDLRNMPFTTGRQLHWFTDIAPVAGPRLTQLANITQDGDVCVLWQCVCGKTYESYCFPKGDILGSVMVWLDRPILNELPQDTGGPWTLYNPRRDRRNMTHFHHKLLPGNDSFCKWFRTTGSYKENGRFVAILDIAVINYVMSSSDSKDTYIINEKNEKVNVFIDQGKAFYPEKLRLIASIYQCCKIRKKVYDALLKLQYNFEEAFNNETKTDQLYPVLDFDEINAMKTRIHTILKFVEVCQYRFGQSSVYLDI